MGIIWSAQSHVKCLSPACTARLFAGDSHLMCIGAPHAAQSDTDGPPVCAAPPVHTPPPVRVTLSGSGAQRCWCTKCPQAASVRSRTQRQRSVSPPACRARLFAGDSYLMCIGVPHAAQSDTDGAQVCAAPPVHTPPPVRVTLSGSGAQRRWRTKCPQAASVRSRTQRQRSVSPPACRARLFAGDSHLMCIGAPHAAQCSVRLVFMGFVRSAA
jgi:hypothetical protein